MRLLKFFLIYLLVTAFSILNAQQVNDFFYAEPSSKSLPVFVRGNLASGKILLFIQGGGAENGIDFGRSNYAGWKNNLEKKVAIAYFDQRGLNKRVKKIDKLKINSDQVLIDIITLAKSLQNRYKADIYLFGHSMGGVKALKCLGNFGEDTSFIKAGIVFNSPITSDFSAERYTYYRPLYLKNLASEFINNKDNVKFWEEAYNWMDKTDSINTIESSKKWNYYVDKAFPIKKRKITIGMALKVIFSRPYNPIKYLNNKDNKFISDKLWYAEKNKWEIGNNTTLWELLPKIEHPILLITGRYDAIAIPEELQVADGLIEKSNLIILPNCGHESFLDQPELFATSIFEYLEIN